MRTSLPAGSGRAVRKIAPFSETDPLGIYVAVLSMWSAAIGGTVKVSSRGSAGPYSCGRPWWPERDAVREPRSGPLITSGASLVNHLWNQQEATAETEHGRDVRALVVEEEWTEVLKRVKRDPPFTTKLRAAWDGATLRNTTKEEAQEVRDPAMVLHSHITLSDWAKYVGESEASGGSYNRILPFLPGSVPMLDDDRVSLPKLDGSELSDAYGRATARPRVIPSPRMPARCGGSYGATPKVKRQPLSLADKVRARTEMNGSRATSSQVLPFVGATAEEVKALPGIVVTAERSGKTGRPATVFTLRGDSSRHPERQPASAERGEPRHGPHEAVARFRSRSGRQPVPRSALDLPTNQAIPGRSAGASFVGSTTPT
ncbi:hypothetical protein OG338_04160 [Streptomyces sp. NBC_00726]|uniref:hypothetical protein n=1 Tax=Streptomyces sp. NBC_00726 TaxID=2903674 RepID=UPI00386E2C77